jgi:CRISPR-associated protein Csb2
MAFQITATFPLGTYRGAAADGSPEAVPSVARLHAALLCAAGFGPRAQTTADGLALADPDEAALRWIEENPPDGVTIPPIQVNRGQAIAYRDDGTLKKSKQVISIKKFGKAPDVSVAVNGVFSWTWSHEPPAEVAAAIESLCGDVPYLGTTESPVILNASWSDGTDTSHVLDLKATSFSLAGHAIEIPRRGRGDELAVSHQAATALPSMRADKDSSDEWSRAAAPTRLAVQPARYRPVRQPDPDAPWARVFLLPLEEPVPVRDRVRFAVAAHRTLVRALHREG